MHVHEEHGKGPKLPDAYLHLQYIFYTLGYDCNHVPLQSQAQWPALVDWHSKRNTNLQNSFRFASFICCFFSLISSLANLHFNFLEFDCTCGSLRNLSLTFERVHAYSSPVSTTSFLPPPSAPVSSPAFTKSRTSREPVLLLLH